MSFRRKIFLICLALLLTAAVLAIGSFHVFLGMDNQLENLQVYISSGVEYVELVVSMDKLRLLTETWIKTGDIKYKREALEVLAHNLELISSLRLSLNEQSGFDSLSSYLLKLKAVLLSISDDPMSPEFSGRADEIISLFEFSFVEVDSIHLSYVAGGIRSVEASRKYRSGLTSLMATLVVVCILMVGALIMMVGRVLDEPYSKLLEATERVAAGDLLYRIKENEQDREFGLIASRFNQMVGNLQRANKDLHDKVWQTELLLEASRLSEKLEDMAPAMEQLVRSIAGKLGYDVCIVLRYDETTESLKVLASSTGEYYHGDPVSFGQDATARLLNSPGPIRIYAEGGADALLDKMHDSDVLLVPITAEQGVSVGLIALFGGSPDLDADYNDTFMLLSTVVGTAIRSADLHGETSTSLRQLTLINELGRAITSVYDPKELIESLATRIAGLTNAKRCLIMIIEGDKLKAVSSFGPLDIKSIHDDIPLGKGMAGWVAKEGKPLLVVDTKSLPEEMNYPPTTSRTAISVPLVKEGKITGVLGIYDKYDENEQIVPFAKDDLLFAEGLASITAVTLERSFIQEKHEKAMLAKEQSEKKFDLLFESVQGGIVTLDRDFNITTANKFIERWCDKPLNEIVGKNALDVFHSKDGICPHCAATGTFSDGGINSITQSFGLNYAELSSYPSIDENGIVTEAVVFIQDITDRVLYQEEIMGLYREVVQNKEYIESLISNSADAIVTTDLEGNVISWNPSAEVIYGYTKEEVDGKPLPYVPDDLKGVEHYNWEKIRGGDVVNIEIFRVRKDGTQIDTSLTMSPIKDATGDIIGMSSISRDITERKRVEKELIRRNQELSRLFLISSAARGTLDLDVLIRMVLSAVTMGDGLGFNRAILFLSEKEEGVLRAFLGIGPGTREDAYKIWDELSTKKMTLKETLHAIETGEQWTESFLDSIDGEIVIPLEGDTVMSKVVREKRPYLINVGQDDLPVDQMLVDKLQTSAYAAVPLISRDKVIGAIWVDNKITMKPISREDMKFLIGFADQVASAIENARLFQKVSLAEAELENIFSSISDMVFLTDKDCVIKNVNQAVVNKIGLPREEIVGELCYRIFHGTEEPWQECPHHRTLDDLKPYIEEVEDKHLNGTFITSTAPMFDSERSFTGTVHVMRDVTEMNELKKRLQSSEKMAALGEVAAKVAHEIRNPLVSVGGFARRLESELVGSQMEFAGIIAEEVERLEQILREILGFVKEVRQNRRDVDLNLVISGVLDLMRPEIRASGNTLSSELHPEGISINIDPDRFREVVLNILSNANIATSNGHITVRTYLQKGKCVFEAEDTGTGIEDEEIGRIFDPFYTTKSMGTGLGLAVTKRIVEENNGVITVENKSAGGGAIFRVYLPLQEGINEDSRG